MDVLKNQTFQATDKLGNSYFYEFRGLDMNDHTGCGYIILQNLSLNRPTYVEYAWFRQRKIQEVQPGMKTIYKENGNWKNGVYLNTLPCSDGLVFLLKPEKAPENDPCINIPCSDVKLAYGQEICCDPLNTE